MSEHSYLSNSSSRTLKHRYYYIGTHISLGIEDFYASRSPSLIVLAPSSAWIVPRKTWFCACAA